MAQALLFSVILCAAVKSSLSAGSVAIDSLTFDKVIGAHKAVLVKFDRSHAYGPKEDAFQEVAKRAATQKDLLVATVGISDYGDKVNDDLRKRFNVSKDEYPVFKLFLKGMPEPLNYTGDVTADDLTRFVKVDGGLWIGLPGCLELFDGLAGTFVGSDANARSDTVAIAETAVGSLEDADKKAAEIYVKTMKKILEKGEDYVTKEVTRVNGLLKGKLSDEKKSAMKQRLNVLASFQLVSKTAKDEL